MGRNPWLLATLRITTLNPEETEAFCIYAYARRNLAGSHAR